MGELGNGRMGDSLATKEIGGDEKPKVNAVNGGNERVDVRNLLSPKHGERNTKIEN